MIYLPSFGSGRWGALRRGLPILGLGLLLAGPMIDAAAQEVVTITELEGLYRKTLADYEGAFALLEVLTSQFDRASQDLTTALAAGDEAGKNRAYAETLRIAPLRRQAQRRVEEKVAELRDARDRLLATTADQLEGYLAVADTAADPENQRALFTFISNTETRLRELRNLEDPPINLEPVQDINVEPRDGPTELRAKATILDFTATQFEGQQVYYAQQLQGLRRDQNLLRRSGDFLADFNRFDDPSVPVTTGTRAVPQPGQVQPPPGADSLGVAGGFLTLEQRIKALEVLQDEIAQRIQAIRVRAETLRRLAGGEWA